MLLSTHSLRVGRAFVFVLQLYRHGPERQQITFFKSGDWKGSCNSFNKYFARLICIRSHCVHQILQQYLHSSWKNISLMKQIQSQLTDLGGRGSEHRGSMKVISDGLEIIPPWLGLRYHQPKCFHPACLHDGWRVSPIDDYSEEYRAAVTTLRWWLFTFCCLQSSI